MVWVVGGGLVHGAWCMMYGMVHGARYMRHECEYVRAQVVKVLCS
jgi:hypothetical protein